MISRVQSQIFFGSFRVLYNCVIKFNNTKQDQSNKLTIGVICLSDKFRRKQFTKVRFNLHQHNDENFRFSPASCNHEKRSQCPTMCLYVVLLLLLHVGVYFRGPPKTITFPFYIKRKWWCVAYAKPTLSSDQPKREKKWKIKKKYFFREKTSKDLESFLFSHWYWIEVSTRGFKLAAPVFWR